MDWLRLGCGYVGMAVGIIGGNIVWLLHCHRTSRMWTGSTGLGVTASGKELNRRKKRGLPAFTAISLGSFVLFFVWR
jgi:hypothetical protein